MSIWEDFFDYVLPDVPGCTQDLAMLHIKSAAIEFCEKTGVITSDTEPVDIVGGEAEYELSAQAFYGTNTGIKYTPAYVKSAYVAGIEIRPTSEDELKRQYFDWRLRTAKQPSHFVQREPYVMRLYPVPIDDIDGALQITFAVKPSRDSTGVADFVFDKYVDQISAGAVARLAAIPAKPWTNQELVVMKSAVFRAGIKTATAEANKNFSRSQKQIQLKRII